MVEALLSSEHSTKVLQNYFNNTEIKYVSSAIVPLSEDAEGFLGEHYRFMITYEKNGIKDTVKLFVKTKPVKNQIQAEITNRSPVYIKEIFLYNYLFKDFEKYGYDTSFAAKSHYCIANQTLVLDDLSLQNYQLHPRCEKFTMEEIKCLLKSLAMYHGAGFAYERTKTKELGREYHLGKEYPKEFLEVFFYLYTNAEYTKKEKFWKGNYVMLEKLIDELPKNENYKKEFKSLIKEAKFCKTFVQENNLAKTCGHGDLWSNNMMFKYQNNVAQTCCLLDFQISRYNCPGIDVILAIYSNTSPDLRKTHLQELYQYYYDILSDILDNYGYQISEIMTLEDYYESINVFKHEILAQVAVINGIIYIPKNILTECVKKEDDSMDKIFNDKVDLCIEAFNTDDIYKQIMIESMDDLYNALFNTTNIKNDIFKSCL